MKVANAFLRVIEAAGLMTLACIAAVPLPAQVSPAKPPNPPLTLPGPQRHEPPPPTGAGDVEGFVYWDASKITHTPASSCSGLSITVSSGSNSGGSSTAYTPLGTLSNNFKYVGQVKEFLAGGKINVYEVCTYGFDHVPVGPNLIVKLAVSDTSSFSPVAAGVLRPVVGPLNIINGMCNSLPEISNPGPSDLFAHWGSCQNMAYNVNFSIQLTGHAFSAGGGGSTPNSGGMLLSSTPQQGLLVAGASANAQGSPTSQPAARKAGVQNPGTNVTLNPQPLPPKQQMTNADVVGMLNSKVPESVILSTLKSATHNFDFSPAGCAQLQQAHITANVLNAMGDGSVRPCPTIQGNSPSPGTSTPGAASSAAAARPSAMLAGGATNAVGAGALSAAPAKAPSPLSAPTSTAAAGSPPKMPPMNDDPKRDAAPPADAATTAAIKSKLQAQVTAAGQLLHSSSTGNVNPPSSAAPEIQALQRQNANLGSLRTQTGVAKDQIALTNAPNLGNVTPPTAPPDPKLVAPQPVTTVCAGTQIYAVNGAKSGVVFTQDPAYNDYIITGCGFGSQQGQAYLSGALTSGRINLLVKHWSDTQIEVAVEPGLTGVLDGWPDLIVAPLSGSPAKLPNCRFYAQRTSVILQGIPQQYVTLANVPVGDSTHGAGTLYCPGPDLSHLFPCVSFNAGEPLDGITNGHDHRSDPNEIVSNAVDRDGGQEEFNAGEDSYDLSYMAPGFEVDYASVFWYAWTSDVCEGWASDAFPKKPGDSVAYDTEGHYAWSKKTNTKVVVDWGVDHCAWRWLGIFRVDDWYNSGYSLQVYVKGPIGVDPWTGHATTNSNPGVLPPNRVVQLPQ